MKQQALEILDEMMEERTPYKEDMPLHKTLGYELCHGGYIALEEAKSRIQAIDGWIRVEDKLPEEIQNNRVLTNEDGLVRIAIYDRGWIREDNENLCYFDFWMPLPLPLNNNLYDRIRNIR